MSKLYSFGVAAGRSGRWNVWVTRIDTGYTERLLTFNTVTAAEHAAAALRWAAAMDGGIS